MSEYVWVAKFVGGAVTALVFLAVLWNLFCRTKENIQRWYWRIRFWRIFGSWPLTKDPTRKKILQGIVDEVLSPLEKTFRTLCKAEEDLQREYREPKKKDLEARRNDLKSVKQIQRNLARAKRRFYGACDTAKEFGFAVQTQKEVER